MQIHLHSIPSMHERRRLLLHLSLPAQRCRRNGLVVISRNRIVRRITAQEDTIADRIISNEREKNVSERLLCAPLIIICEMSIWAASNVERMISIWVVHSIGFAQLGELDNCGLNDLEKTVLSLLNYPHFDNGKLVDQIYCR